MKLSFTVIWIYIFICCGNLSYSQSQNPFDIKSDSAYTNETETVESLSQTKDKWTISHHARQHKFSNPFDVDTSKVITNSQNETDINQKSYFSFDYTMIKTAYKGGSSGFIFWLLLIILGMVAVLVSINRELVIRLIRSGWFNNLINTLFRNFGTRDMLVYLLLYLNFIFTISIFVYKFLNLKSELGGFNFYVLIFLLILGIYVIKHLMIFLVSVIFDTLSGINIYNFLVFTFNIILGLCLIPIDAFVAFSPDSIAEFFMVFGQILIVFFYIFRLIRGFLSTNNFIFDNLFHFFIYLCAFEILPLLVLYKFGQKLL